jgi:hypothetical protein
VAEKNAPSAADATAFSTRTPSAWTRTSSRESSPVEPASTVNGSAVRIRRGSDAAAGPVASAMVEPDATSTARHS